MEVKCPYCGAVYEVELNELGKNANCEICGKVFLLGQTARQTDTVKQAPQASKFSIGALVGHLIVVFGIIVLFIFRIIAIFNDIRENVARSVEIAQLEKELAELEQRNAELKQRKAEAKQKSEEPQKYARGGKVNKKELSGTEGFVGTGGTSREAQVASTFEGNPLLRFRFGESGNNSSMRLTGFHGFEKITLGYTSQKRLFSICLTASKSSDYMVHALMKDCDLCYPGLRWNVDTNHKGELFASGRRRDLYGRVELLVSIVPLYDGDVRIQANIFDYCVKRIDDGDS